MDRSSQSIIVINPHVRNKAKKYDAAESSAAFFMRWFEAKYQANEFNDDNVSSQMGHVGGPNRTTYCSSKFAIEGFTKSLAIELGPDGIRVNAICPTFIQTPMTEPFLKDEDFKKTTIGMIPIGRLGEVTDLMGPFVFLASEASSLMTGSSILVDGGWTAR